MLFLYERAFSDILDRLSTIRRDFASALLVGVPDPYDYYSPLHRWTFRFSQAEMNQRLGPYVPGALRGIRVTKRGDSPRTSSASYNAKISASASSS